MTQWAHFLLLFSILLSFHLYHYSFPSSYVLVHSDFSAFWQALFQAHTQSAHSVQVLRHHCVENRVTNRADSLVATAAALLIIKKKALFWINLKLGVLLTSQQACHHCCQLQARAHCVAAHTCCDMKGIVYFTSDLYWADQSNLSFRLFSIILLAIGVGTLIKMISFYNSHKNLRSHWALPARLSSQEQWHFVPSLKLFQLV